MSLDRLADTLTNMKRAEMQETTELRRQLYEIEQRYLGARTALIQDTFDALDPDTVEYLNEQFLNLQYRSDGEPLKVHTIREYRTEFRLVYGFDPPLRWVMQQVNRAFMLDRIGT